MADKKKSILVRIPPELWEDLNVWARDELRSLNAQIEYLLREAIRRRRGRRDEPAPGGPRQGAGSADRAPGE